MAYVYVGDGCLDGDHAACPGKENTPSEAQRAAGYAGGGHCICSCHRDGKRVKQEWFDEVRAMSERSRERRNTA